MRISPLNLMSCSIRTGNAPKSIGIADGRGSPFAHFVFDNRVNAEHGPIVSLFLDFKELTSTLEGFVNMREGYG
jgi:hypothetical protein